MNMKKIILSLVLLVSGLSMLTAFAETTVSGATPSETAVADTAVAGTAIAAAPTGNAGAEAVGTVGTKASILQTDIVPYLIANDCSDSLAKAINPATTPVTNNALARWSGTNGLFIKNSGIIVDDLNNMTGVNNLTAGGTITAADVTVTSFGAGVVHSDVSGVLSSSPVVDADIVNNTISGAKITDLTITGAKLADATITNAKLATVSSTGTPGALVALDSTGSFTATGSTTATNFYGEFSGNAATATSAITSTSATYFTGSLSGDVIGTQDATVVVNVPAAATVGDGVKTAAAVALATTMVEAATTIATPGTLVLRDDTGHFAADRITLVTASVMNPTDATTKKYVDDIASSGLHPLQSVTAYSDTQVSPSGPATIDSVVLSDGSRVLLNGQTDPVENGVWVVDTATTWTWAADYLALGVSNGSYVLVTDGATFAGTSWLSSTPLAVIGTDTVHFGQFGAPGETTANNVGTGAGLIFRDKTSTGGTDFLNLRKLAAGTNIAIDTDVTTPNTITIATTNPIVANVSGDLTGSLLGTVTLLPGSVAAPSLSFVGDSDLGIYRTSAGKMGFVSTFTETMTIDENKVFINNGLSLKPAIVNEATASYIPLSSIGGGKLGYDMLANRSSLQVNFTTSSSVDKTVGLRGASFFSGLTVGQLFTLVVRDVEATRKILNVRYYNETDTGFRTYPIIMSQSASITFIFNGAVPHAWAPLAFSSDLQPGTLMTSDGSAASPSITFNGDLNTGIYNPAAETIGFATNATERMIINTNSIDTQVPVQAAWGSATSPAYSFTSDTNTGIYHPAAETMGFVGNGVEVMRTTSYATNFNTMVSMTSSTSIAVGPSVAAIGAITKTITFGSPSLQFSEWSGTAAGDYRTIISTPVALPRGTILTLSTSFINTSANARNVIYEFLDVGGITTNIVFTLISPNVGANEIYTVTVAMGPLGEWVLLSSSTPYTVSF